MHFGMSSDPDKNYRRARTTALVLLLILGITALGGAIPMLIDPSGEKMGFPPDMLARTPFEDFLFPGIILALFNGILSLLFSILVIKRHRLMVWMVLFQGGVLFIWLTAEVIMGLFSPALTIPYYLIAILLLYCGVAMRLSSSISQSFKHPDDQLRSPV